MATRIHLPGIGGSGKAHWHSQWERADPSIRRFQPTSWDTPVLADWITAVDRAVGAATGDVVLVAHSLSCLLVAHWAAQTQAQIAGAFLVAVPDPAGPNFPKAATLGGFGPVPDTALPFPTLILASSNDPYGTVAYARSKAALWQADIVEMGALGHMNGDSGLADWPEGRRLLQAFCAGLGD